VVLPYILAIHQHVLAVRTIGTGACFQFHHPSSFTPIHPKGCVRVFCLRSSKTGVRGSGNSANHNITRAICIFFTSTSRFVCRYYCRRNGLSLKSRDPCLAVQSHDIFDYKLLQPTHTHTHARTHAHTHDGYKKCLRFPIDITSSLSPLPSKNSS